MADDLSVRYGDLLTGSYDCVDRIVLNAYYPLGHNPGGFRTWWRRLHGGSEEYLAAHAVGTGVFLILVARAPARVWEIRKSSAGVIGNIAKKIAYVNHY